MRLILLSLFLISCTAPKYSQETAKQVDRTVAVVQRHHPEDPDINRLKYDTERHSNESPTGVDTDKLSMLAKIGARILGLDPAILTAIFSSVSLGGYGITKHVAAKKSDNRVEDLNEKFQKERLKRFGAMHPDDAKKEEV